MIAERPTQTATRKPLLVLWLAWGGLILIGGTLVTALVSTFVSIAKDGLHSRKLPFLLFIVVFVVIFYCLKAALHPIRGRTDERQTWKERFPVSRVSHLEICDRIYGTRHLGRPSGRRRPGRLRSGAQVGWLRSAIRGAGTQIRRWSCQHHPLMQRPHIALTACAWGTAASYGKRLRAIRTIRRGPARPGANRVVCFVYAFYASSRTGRQKHTGERKGGLVEIK